MVEWFIFGGALGIPIATGLVAYGRIVGRVTSVEERVDKIETKVTGCDGCSGVTSSVLVEVKQTANVLMERQTEMIRDVATIKAHSEDQSAALERIHKSMLALAQK